MDGVKDEMKCGMAEKESCGGAATTSIEGWGWTRPVAINEVVSSFAVAGGQRLSSGGGFLWLGAPTFFRTHWPWSLNSRSTWSLYPGQGRRALAH